MHIKWEEILQACDAAKRRCLLTNPQGSFMNDKEKKLFKEIHSAAILERDWSIYNKDTLQVFKECHPDFNLLDALAEDVLLEALDKWRQRNEIEKEKRNAVQEALIKMRAENDVVCAIKVVERKVDNVARNSRNNIRIARDIKKQLVCDDAATCHDNDGEFEPDFEGKDDEALLMDAWKAVHPDEKGKRRAICLGIYRKVHPKATIDDKEFQSFYQTIAYQLRRETTHSQS